MKLALPNSYLKSLFLFATIVFGTQSYGQSVPTIFCHDTDTFTPIKFIVEDDGVHGPVIKFEGTHSFMVLAGLGLTSENDSGRDLTITLPNQPRKSINSLDHQVRQYTSFDLTGSSVASYLNENGTVMQKDVTFDGLEIEKHMTASRGTYYSVILRLQHSNQNWSYSKFYYSYSCH